MIIGIDLGTTNSLCAIWQNGQAKIIPNALNEALTPSVVSVDEQGHILVGAAARERLSTHPESTVAAFKRFMGSQRVFELGNHHFRAEELSALVLKQLKADAEAYLGESVTEAVITVPAYFNDTQRKATKNAGELAGLKVERLLNEPTAAALAYGLHQHKDESKYLVFDLGGGTFDISILELFDGVMEVHASAGDNFLGGEDFTDSIVKALIQKYQHTWPQHDGDLPALLRSQLEQKAEQIKRQLSSKQQVETSLVWKDQAYPLQFSEAEFEACCRPLLDKLVTPIQRALRDAKTRSKELDEVVLVGGATRMPILRKLATRLFQRFPATGIDPDQVVACGAAVQAGLKQQDAALNDIVMTDVAPYTLGIETAHGEGVNTTHGHFSPIIERNSFIPVSRVERFYTRHPEQTVVEINVFQGEHPFVKDNILLGNLSCQVPKNKEANEAVDVRFTYDINGILEVQVEIVSTQQKSVLLIEKNPGVLSKEEIQRRLKELEDLKVHPRDQQENKVLLARAERLYSETLGDLRHYIGEQLNRFNLLLEKQNVHDIRHARKEFNEWLKKMEDDSYL